MSNTNRQRLLKVAAVLIIFVAGFVIGSHAGLSRNIPFLSPKSTQWAIGIYVGDSPFNLCVADTTHPVLTAKDVTDVRALFVGDPFMVNENSTWYMFFEVLNGDTKQGDIGLATSNDALNWTYQQIVLDEPFHLSYPYVFKWKDDYYMIPESRRANSVRLYKAIDFPTRWSFVTALLSKGNFADSSIFRHDNKWWLFTETSSEVKCDTLRLYHANDLVGPWIEHPESPVIEGNANIARPGGRVLVFEGRIIRYTQDDDPTYGKQVRAFEITELTSTSYEEKEVSENPILGPSGTGWNARRMHHLDAHQIDGNKWIACVDGRGEKLVLDLGIKNWF